MATGLTFGSIAALYRYTNGLISQAQYSQLVTVVILSAFVPTLVAQQFFEPDLDAALGGREAAGEEDFAAIDPRACHTSSPTRVVPDSDDARRAGSGDERWSYDRET